MASVLRSTEIHPIEFRFVTPSLKLLKLFEKSLRTSLTSYGCWDTFRDDWKLLKTFEDRITWGEPLAGFAPSALVCRLVPLFFGLVPGVLHSGRIDKCNTAINYYSDGAVSGR